jgi:hypothetical protein
MCPVHVVGRLVLVSDAGDDLTTVHLVAQVGQAETDPGYSVLIFAVEDFVDGVLLDEGGVAMRLAGNLVMGVHGEEMEYFLLTAGLPWT